MSKLDDLLRAKSVDDWLAASKQAAEYSRDNSKVPRHQQTALWQSSGLDVAAWRHGAGRLVGFSRDKNRPARVCSVEIDLTDGRSSRLPDLDVEAMRGPNDRASSSLAETPIQAAVLARGVFVNCGSALALLAPGTTRWQPIIGGPLASMWKEPIAVADAVISTWFDGNALRVAATRRGETTWSEALEGDYLIALASAGNDVLVAVGRNRDARAVFSLVAGRVLLGPLARETILYVINADTLRVSASQSWDSHTEALAGLEGMILAAGPRAFKVTEVGPPEEKSAGKIGYYGHMFAPVGTREPFMQRDTGYRRLDAAHWLRIEPPQLQFAAAYVVASNVCDVLAVPGGGYIVASATYSCVSLEYFRDPSSPPLAVGILSGELVGKLARCGRHVLGLIRESSPDSKGGPPAMFALDSRRMSLSLHAASSDGSALFVEGERVLVAGESNVWALLPFSPADARDDSTSAALDAAQTFGPRIDTWGYRVDYHLLQKLLGSVIENSDRYWSLDIDAQLACLKSVLEASAGTSTRTAATRRSGRALRRIPSQRLAAPLARVHSPEPPSRGAAAVDLLSS